MSHPRVGVAAFVIRGNRFVIGVRKGSHGSGTVQLPGGHLEQGETFETCAAREVLEETGLQLDLSKIEFLAATNDVFGPNKHYVTIFMVGNVTNMAAEPESRLRGTSILSTAADEPDNDVIVEASDDRHIIQDQQHAKEPDSQPEWTRLIQAFTKKNPSKDKEQAAKLSQQCQAILDNTVQNAERKSRKSLEDIDKRAAKLDLDSKMLPISTPIEEWNEMREEQMHDTQAQLDAIDSILESMLENRVSLINDMQIAINERKSFARKVYKQAKRTMADELELNAELAAGQVHAALLVKMGRMSEVQRKLLEQLMGAEAMGIIEHDLSLWDPKVCPAFVAGVCPHDLFTNTKMDLGTCPRTHSAKLRNEYQAMLKKAEEENDQPKILELNRMKVNYEQVIYAFIDECDRRIRAAHRRLEKTPEENNRATNLMREIGEIEGAYQAAMTEVERLGSEGKVEESMTELSKAEALKTEKEDKERELQQLTETSGASGHQKLRVCDICGAYLSVLDSDRRLADHFGGKMHLGYHQLRTYIDEWRARGPLPVSDPPRHGMNGSSAPRPGPTIPNGPPSHMMPPPAHANSFGGGAQPPSGPRHNGPTVPQGPPAPGFVPAGPAAGIDRDNRRDRDSGSSRRYDDDRRGGSSRYDEDRRSSRYDDDRRRPDDRDRASATNGFNPSSSRSSRREEDGAGSDRRRRYDDEDDYRPSRRSYDDGGDSKRRRTDDA
ncbi:splicing factor [Microbotryomycetes sp. JL221]|nr:splicing factor [Microbotryomycetes sp. JL221]